MGGCNVRVFRRPTRRVHQRRHPDVGARWRCVAGARCRMTVWYDFTTTLRNTGRSGIAATEWHLGTALIEAHPDVRCFALRDRRGLIEIDARTDLGGAFYASATAVAPPVVTRSVPTWRGRVRVAIKPVLGRFADPIVGALATMYRWPVRARRAVSRSFDRSLTALRRPA